MGVYPHIGVHPHMGVQYTSMWGYCMPPIRGYTHIWGYTSHMGYTLTDAGIPTQMEAHPSTDTPLF